MEISLKAFATETAKVCVFSEVLATWFSMTSREEELSVLEAWLPSLSREYQRYLGVAHQSAVSLTMIQIWSSLTKSFRGSALCIATLALSLFTFSTLFIQALLPRFQARPQLRYIC